MEHPSESEQTLRRQLAAFSQFTTRSLGESNIDSLNDRCLHSREGRSQRQPRQASGVPAGPGPPHLTCRHWLEGGLRWAVPSASYLDTPIGHAFALSEAVPISDYTIEKKYSYPSILKEHGCVASLNVPLRTDLGTFGILEVDHTSARAFSADDVNFLTGLGNTVARAVELRRALRGMENALEQKQLLIREINHRIKNNLSLVGAMLSLQARRFPDPNVRDELANAVARINNLALVHDRLQLFTSSVTRVEAAPHFQDLCEMLRSLLPAGVALTPNCSGSIRGTASNP